VERREHLSVTLVAAMAMLLCACTHPCDALEQRVCELEVDKVRCALIQDPERRELLARATCDGILEVMDARR
jgi:hypothetical protein